MKIDVAGVYAKRKLLKSGQVRTYYYHRATGKRLPDDPTSSEFHSMCEKLNAKPIGVAPAARTFRDLKKEYLVSTDFAGLRDSTRSEYERHIAYLEPVLGPFPVSTIQPIHAEKLMQNFAQRPTLAKAIRRTLSTLLSYAAHILRWIPMNPLVLPKRRGRKKAPSTGQKPYEEHEIQSFRLVNRLAPGLDLPSRSRSGRPCAGKT